MMTPQQLKNSILQRAIEGKLVEQRPEEGTAKDLLKEIKLEKEKLVKEGKIKKSKPLPAITDDEIPFDIPDSWEWCRISDVTFFQEGPGILAKDFRNSGIPLIRIAGMLGEKVSLSGCNFLDPDMVEKKWSHFKLDLNDIVISSSASLDKIAIVDQTAVGSIPYTGLIRFKMISKMYRDYFIYFIKSPCYINQINEQKQGGTIKHYGPTHLNKMLIPLPPLSEQHRIVAKIEELLPLVDQYDKAYSQLTDLNENFPQDMKKSILQYAIEGKLVEQRPEEGTAKELLKEIKLEKEKLVKEGKIKKSKPLPSITEDEIPFDIPDNWEWVRLGELFNMQAGKNISAASISHNISDEHPFQCYGGNGVRGYVSDYNRNGVYPLIGRQGALCGNVHLAQGKFYATEHAVVTELFACTNPIWAKYFLVALNLNQYATATAQPGLAVSKIENVLIPLPPLSEQHRIVSKIEELMPLCDKLVKTK